ncbi:MAG TPA: STAS domain-containing protein [Phenylobacterium sp.]|jgi:chemotaxis protein CheX
MALESSPQGVRLPEIMDLNAARPLAADLLELRGGAVTLDGSQVTRLGGLCLQVLLSAQATWAADGQAFQVAAPSPEFDQTLSLFGAAAFDPGRGTSS